MPCHSLRSTVSIISLVDATVKVETWVTEVSSAMETFFDCKCYSTSFTNRVDWCFYGTESSAVSCFVAMLIILQCCRVGRVYCRGGIRV